MIAACEPAQGQQLPVVEEITPDREGVAHGLPRVVAVLQRERGQQELTSLSFLPESCRTLPVCRLVFGCGGQILLGPAAREHEFAVKPESGPHVGRSDRVQDRELVAAVPASGLGTFRSAMLGIEFRAA